MVWKKTFDLKVGVVVERRRGDGVCAGDDKLRSRSRVERLVGLFDDGDPAGGACGEAVCEFFWNVGEAARAESLLLAVGFERGGAFHHIKKALRGRGTQLAVGFEFGSVLGESRAESGADVHDGGGPAHAGERGADEGVRSEKQVIAVLRAASLAEMMKRAMHGVNSSFVKVSERPRTAGIRAKRRVA